MVVDCKAACTLVIKTCIEMRSHNSCGISPPDPMELSLPPLPDAVNSPNSAAAPNAAHTIVTNPKHAIHSSRCLFQQGVLGGSGWMCVEDEGSIELYDEALSTCTTAWTVRWSAESSS